MKIAILGYGQEGQAAEKYFVAKGDEVDVFDKFSTEEIAQADLTGYDLVLRSPSVRPQDSWSSMTSYFFENCPCPIIGVTGTKGKGTTCSFISSILEALGQKNYLVGNIGVPSITVLDELKPLDVVIYELSSFQLWDLACSPHVAVLLGIEPDHLNVHTDFEEYIDAKANIVKFQNDEDYCIYNASDETSTDIASISLGEAIGYAEKPASKLAKLFNSDNHPEQLDEVLDYVIIPGQHNRENAEAAVKAVAAFLDLSVAEFLEKYFYAVAEGLANFSGLPHRLEFLREANSVRYYDDNFSTNPASTRVAVEAFPEEPLVLIVGGRDKTGYEDLEELQEVLATPNVQKVILMGESGHEIAQRYQDARFLLAESLTDAVNTARAEAEKTPGSIVLMSPAAASFDMFQNVYDRGDQFKKLISKI